MDTDFYTDSYTSPAVAYITARTDSNPVTYLDLMASYGYTDPNAYVVTVTHTDRGASTASDRTYILRRHSGQ